MVKISPMIMLVSAVFLLALSLAVVDAFSASPSTSSSNPRKKRNTPARKASQVEQVETPPPTGLGNNVPRKPNPPFWEIAPTMNHQKPRPLTPKLQRAMETGTHPEESAEELGQGIFITSDWREAWGTYESPPENPDLIDPDTGYAEYEIDDIEGVLPDNLVGTLYRNGPGKFGVAGERVQHVLDADGMVYKITFPPPDAKLPRRVMFKSRFVETKEFQEEQTAGRFLYRGVFGSGPTAQFFDDRPKNGLNSDPIEPSMAAKVLGSAFNTNIKNAANTQVISWGGKLLALFESALPYALDPDTLKTIGEDTLGGVLKSGLPVKMGGGMPSEFEPDFIGGTAHTAHPNVCPKTGNLVGWHWKQIVATGSLEVTFTEWDEEFSAVASKTFELNDCELAPHDMAITENCIIVNINSLKMNQAPFLLGLKGPAASLTMDGRASITTWVFPRPTAAEQFEPYAVKTPPCFTIHFSHAYKDEITGNLVSFFSGWPPSDSKDFLGAWGGFAPHFPQISPTKFWRMEIDPRSKTCVSHYVAPGAANMCVEHMLVHPNFNIRKAQNVYGTTSNAVDDSTAPCGYAKLKVETGGQDMLKRGEFNDQVDCYWFGTRFFASEPLIVPKSDGDPDKEEEAYLLGVVRDAARKRDFLAIFDLERDLREGPVCRLYLKSGVPHGLHGCFAPHNSKSSIFC